GAPRFRGNPDRTARLRTRARRRPRMHAAGTGVRGVDARGSPSAFAHRCTGGYTGAGAEEGNRGAHVSGWTLGGKTMSADLKLFETDSSTEVWRSDGAPLFTYVHRP